MHIGERLRHERERLGYTQSEFSKLCGVAFRTYCDYEAAKTEPKASFFAALNEVGGDVMYIITGCRNPQHSMSVEEQKLVDNYRAMDDAARLNVQAVGAAFATSKVNVKKSIS